MRNIAVAVFGQSRRGLVDLGVSSSVTFHLVSQRISASTTDKVSSGVFTPEPGIPTTLSLLRWKLGCKAKQETDFRFYALYDRIYRRDVLMTAYKLAKEYKGSPGVDNISFDDIENSESGVRGLIDTLHEELRMKSYRPCPVRRRISKKENGRVFRRFHLVRGTKRFGRIRFPGKGRNFFC